VSPDAEQSNRPGGRKRPLLPRWLRNPAGAVLIVAVVLGLLGTLPMAGEIGRPFGGFIAYGAVAHDTAEFGRTTPSWWPVIVDGTLRYGDYLPTIDGLPFTPNAWSAFADAYAEARPVMVEVQRGDVELNVLVNPVLVTLSDVLDVKFSDTIVGIVYLLLATLVLRARPRHVTNQVFAVAAACVAVHRLTVDSSLITTADLADNVPRVGHMLVAGLIGPLLVHLAFVFPTPRPPRPRALLPVVYTIGAISGVALALTRLPFWAAVSPSVNTFIDTLFYQSMLLMLLAGVLALFGRLIWSWRRERDTLRQQRAARVILLGLLGSLPAVLFILAPVVPGMSTSRAAFWRGFDVRYLMLSIPIAFAYVILRYQTFLGFSRLFLFIMIVSLSGLLAAVGSWLWRLGVPTSASTARPPLVLLFTFILLASLLWSVQSSWRGWFGRYLHWEPRTYDAARAFGRRVMSATNPRELPQTMAGALVDELALERAAVWLWQAETGRLQLVAAAGFADEGLPDSLPAPPYPGDGHPMRLQPAELVPAWLAPLAADGRVELAVPLLAEGVPIGLLGLGRRWDEEIFDNRDLAVAELVGQQATLFLQAAQQVEELRRVPDRVAAAQERERLRVAGELHDTIQQFLGRLPFFLAVSRDRMRDDPQTAADIIDRCLTDVEDAAAMLRAIRVNLAPNQLETNLLHSLNGLIGHVRQRTGLAVSLATPPDLDESLSPETRHALYRVIQQALDNTVAHAGAAAVDVTLARENGRVVFAVRDNGRGSSAEERRMAQAEGSFGLKSMQARLELCGGALQFDSVPDQGTTVAGWVPAASSSASSRVPSGVR
jgi:signal transduction histidine kinase